MPWQWFAVDVQGCWITNEFIVSEEPQPCAVIATNLFSVPPEPCVYSPVVYGEQLTFTATVTAASGAMPTGTVTFYDSSEPTAPALGGGTLSTNDGVTTATFTTSSLALSDHTVTTVYPGTSGDPAE